PIYTDASFIQHGTGAFGMILAQHNGIGVDGLAPAVEPLFVTEFAEEYGWGVASAILRSLQHVRAGDLILIEAQTGGPRYNLDNPEQQTGLLPVEWNQAEFDAIRTATDIGVIVVEAAGNGEQNLDDPIYEGRFDRTVRDSGAVMVCAGNPPSGSSGPAREAIDFTNYGSRCDLEAPGLELYSTGYGDAFRCGDDPNRWYTAQFAGTSGATPLVVGALALLQSQALASERLLLPEAARRLLRGTGLAAVGSRRVGEHADLEAALEGLPEAWTEMAPTRPEIPGFGQRCTDRCEGTLTCTMLVPGESYCLDVCEPFVREDECPSGELCQLQTTGLGSCAPIQGDGQAGDPCLAPADCALNHFCGQDRVCYAFCSRSTGAGCPEGEGFLCLDLGVEFGDIGWCLANRSNPDGEPDGGPCTDNSDCQGGFCITDWFEGYCIDLQCETDDDCNGSQGRCTDVDFEGSRYCLAGCSQNRDCRPGYTCQNTICQEGTVESCRNDSDCPMGQVCRDAACFPEPDPGTTPVEPVNNATTPTNNGTATALGSNNSTAPNNNGSTTPSGNSSNGGGETSSTSVGTSTSTQGSGGSGGPLSCGVVRTRPPYGGGVWLWGLVWMGGWAFRRRRR
ncbi:MAG: S8 family serine peptidase, partial [Myxococcota bacterium]